jgi:hypothetical protein
MIDPHGMITTVAGTGRMIAPDGSISTIAGHRKRRFRTIAGG